MGSTPRPTEKQRFSAAEMAATCSELVPSGFGVGESMRGFELRRTMDAGGVGRSMLGLDGPVPPTATGAGTGGAGRWIGMAGSALWYVVLCCGCWGC